LFKLATYLDQVSRCLGPNGTLAVVCDRDDITIVSDIVSKVIGLHLHHQYYYAVSQWATDNCRKLYQQAMVPVVLGFSFPPFTLLNLKKELSNQPEYMGYLFDFLGEIPASSEWIV